MKKKECVRCGKAFRPNAPARKTCSKTCSRQHTLNYARNYHAAKRASELTEAEKNPPCELCGKKYRKISHNKTCSAECRDRRAQILRQKKYDERSKRDGRRPRTRRGYGMVAATCVICGGRFKTDSRLITMCSDQCRIVNVGGRRLQNYLRRKKLTIAVRKKRRAGA